MRSWFIAIDRDKWARGDSVEDAQRTLRAAGGKLRTHLVYEFRLPDGAEPPYVNNAGYTVYADGGTRELVVATKNGKAIDPAMV